MKPLTSLKLDVYFIIFVAAMAIKGWFSIYEGITMKENGLTVLITELVVFLGTPTIRSLFILQEYIK